ncbi:MBL fold metallo-hydrolase [Candidatus Micrarchaeota archaeon]|nr:MBL fold metallo-hydrolase [Candidatus Micrarchaeota archaeon]
MKLFFLGGCLEVGRSSFLVNVGEVRLLFDAGIKLWDHNELPLMPQAVDAAILSHAHLDHSGAVPTLYKHFNIPTFCTSPTIPITSLLLEDSMKVAKKRNKSCYFSGKELKKVDRNFTPLTYGKEYEFFDGTSFKLHEAGHILGSAQVFLKSPEGTTLLYTGDIKLKETRTHNGAEAPEEEVNILVIESTYARAEHPKREELEKRFCEEVRGVLDEGGVAIVPCFAVGRTQEMLGVLHAHRLEGSRGEVYVDGMGQKINEIYYEFPAYLKNPKALFQAFSEAKNIEYHKQRKKIIERPCVVITTAGMLEGGPVLDYVQAINRRGNGKIFLTGYQVEGTNGRMLLEEGRIKENGKVIRLNVPTGFFDFSAHAGRTELIEYAKKLNPNKVFCVHGDMANCNALAAELSAQGFDAVAPANGSKHGV